MDHMKKNHGTRLHRFIAARCAREGELGLHLTLGVVLLALSAWIFGSIASQVTGGTPWIEMLDRHVAQFLQGHATDTLTRLMLIFTHVHGIAGIGALGLLLGVWFWRKKAHDWLLMAVVAIPGGMLLNALLKQVFMRARPASEDAILTLASYSFPSGHTAAATLLYGIFAAYLMSMTRSKWTRMGIVAVALLMVLLVGASRIYLGVHYFSDVLAAVAESCGWLAICITASSTLRRRRAARLER
ncbi:MAG: membrane-associated phospholipid phosphatase [Janthinobacterium sp.]|jgi:membrane-associated phospholipid phosphatase